MGKRALESHMDKSISLYFKKLAAPSKTSVHNSVDTDTDTQSATATATETNIIPKASQMLMGFKGH